MNSLQQRLKIIRVTLQLQQEQMAKSLGIHQGTYSSIENGKMKLPQRIRERLVFNLKVNPLFLDEGIGPPLLSDQGTIADRVAHLMTHYHMSIAMFSTALGLNEIETAKFTLMLSGKDKFTEEMLNLVCEKFQMVSYEWLKNNDGNMFLPKPPYQSETKIADQTTLKEKELEAKLQACETRNKSLEEINQLLKDQIELLKRIPPQSVQ